MPDREGCQVWFQREQIYSPLGPMVHPSTRLARNSFKQRNHVFSCCFIVVVSLLVNNLQSFNSFLAWVIIRVVCSKERSTNHKDLQAFQCWEILWTLVGEFPTPRPSRDTHTHTHTHIYIYIYNTIYPECFTKRYTRRYLKSSTTRSMHNRDLRVSLLIWFKAKCSLYIRKLPSVCTISCKPDYSNCLKFIH